MLIIPAIDLRNGKVVRLTKGAFDQETVYSLSPADVMQKWQREGAQLVHVVDLDGAKEGVRQNLRSLKNIIAVSKIQIQFGGGLRTFEAVEEILKAGVWRAVVGTKAFDTELIKKLVQKFKERIAIGLDVRDGVIQTHGWQTNESGVQLEDFVQQLEKLGVKTIICTDITRDGTLKGPNIQLLKQLLKVTKMNVVVSGGISSLSDLKKLSQIEASNLEGVIVGKALYEQKVILRDAISELGSR
ncbi:MAG: 1-(5-phosphoribosyl)-5-[(5-phosphoribosylamino)methylideneamino]imidazole-4-carboxamide isomerase [Candidatus Omnitrophica bacterium]|nr:1-(5-phosphoribosyl)-5-[(5-phosphoribosylamino)methylideneamino]imidazole-4-carboxamide isomerase [Candidatus Omnitrophota bacterium]